MNMPNRLASLVLIWSMSRSLFRRSRLYWFDKRSLVRVCRHDTDYVLSFAQAQPLHGLLLFLFDSTSNGDFSPHKRFQRTFSSVSIFVDFALRLAMSRNSLGFHLHGGNLHCTCLHPTNIRHNPKQFVSRVFVVIGS